MANSYEACTSRFKETTPRQTEWIPLCLYVEVLQLGASVQTLVELGYADEARPVVHRGG
jgi:hypothetical protein